MGVGLVMVMVVGVVTGVSAGQPCGCVGVGVWGVAVGAGVWVWVGGVGRVWGVCLCVSSTHQPTQRSARPGDRCSGHVFVSVSVCVRVC